MEKRLNNNVLPEVSEVDLVFRSKVKASLRPKVTDPDDAYKLLIRTWDKEKLELLEQFKVLLLNVKGRVLGIYEASSGRSEEHTSELQSLMRISYAVFCLKKKNIIQTIR